ncbi:MAG: flagellar basal body P-ring formation chaperone FlgA [Pseudomonadota bacterium]
MKPRSVRIDTAAEDSICLVGFLTRHKSLRRKFDGQLRLLGVIAALMLAGAANSLPDEQWQPIADIEHTAATYIKSRIASGNVQSGTLDTRLRLPLCEQPLEPFLRPGTPIKARTTVGVRCGGARPWKVYVPVDLVVVKPVLVPKRVLRVGQIISADDLASDERDVSRMAGGYFADPAEIIGQRVRQQMTAGRIITPTMIEADDIIRRGQSVTLVVKNQVINITMAGKALSDGALNQRIKVENRNSGRIVEGIVRSPEHVEILAATTSGFFSEKPKDSVPVADIRLSNNDR